MTTNQASQVPDTDAFINEAGKLAAEFGWRAETFQREQEAVLVALTETDPLFERIVWVYNLERVSMRCMLISSKKIPTAKLAATFELCARINEGLPFGCVEYSFNDAVLVFRDAADLDTCEPLERVVSDTTARVLNLGRRYAAAIEAMLAGDQPEDAVKKAEAA